MLKPHGNVKETDCYLQSISKDSNICRHRIRGRHKKAVGFCELASQFRCIEDMKDKIIRLSHSAARDFMTCRMKFWYRNVKGVQVKPEYLSNAIKMGKLWDLIQSVEYNVSNKDTLYEYIKQSNMHNTSVAKVEALRRAYKKLIKPQYDNLEGLQTEALIQISAPYVNEIEVHGFLDRSYSDYFVENKLSSRPLNYTNDVFKIMSQLGTYFLSDCKYKYVVMEVVYVPQLRTKDMEEIEDFEDRIYKDIMEHPSKYFIGYNVMTGTYGKKFYRNEFEPFFHDLQRRYMLIAEDIIRSVRESNWYYNDIACMMFNRECEYYSICKNGEGYASEKKYYIREKPSE